MVSPFLTTDPEREQVFFVGRPVHTSVRSAGIAGVILA
jgi:hypothetical protein